MNTFVFTDEMIFKVRYMLLNEIRKEKYSAKKFGDFLKLFIRNKTLRDKLITSETPVFMILFKPGLLSAPHATVKSIQASN